MEWSFVAYSVNSLRLRLRFGTTAYVEGVVYSLFCRLHLPASQRLSTVTLSTLVIV